VTRSAARRAVIFDLDDTLILDEVSTRTAVRAAADVAHERAGVEADVLASAAAQIAEHRFRQAPGYTDDGEASGIWWGEALWGDFAGDTMRAIRGFVPGFREAVWREALARAGSSDAALGLEIGEAYIRARRSHETIDPDAEAALADVARDHRLALLTNGASDVQREKLSRTRLSRYFETVVISDEAGVGKPDPRVFAIALEQLGTAAHDTTMVGDSLPRDVVGAHRAGLRAVWVSRGTAPDGRTAPDATIERLSDLRAAIDELERRPASPRAMP